MAEGLEFDVEVSSYNGQPAAYLAWLNIPEEERSTGIGSKVMREACAFADQMSVILTLRPSKKNRYSGTSSQARLIDFYKRFGFQVDPSDPKVLMYRYPEK